MLKIVIQLSIVTVTLIFGSIILLRLYISEVRYKKFCKLLNPYNNLYKIYLQQIFKNYGKDNVAYHYSDVCEQTLSFVIQTVINETDKDYMIKYLNGEIIENDDRKDTYCEDCNTSYKVGRNLCFIDDIFKHSST